MYSLVIYHVIDTFELKLCVIPGVILVRLCNLVRNFAALHANPSKILVKK